MRKTGRLRAAAAVILLCLVTAEAALAGPYRLGRNSISQRATGVLAVLGITVDPSETASTLQFNSDQDNGMAFLASQLGGAFTVSEDFPLYLEGFIGWSRYDPVFLITDGQRHRDLPARWNTLGATGGIGWDFTLLPGLVLRPILNISLGHVESDASLLERLINHRRDADLNFLRDGKLTAGGIGGSLMLAYEKNYANDWSTNVELRYTQIHLQPIAGSKSIDASSDSATLGLWSRLRAPTPIHIFGEPLRAVFELSGSWLPGDQGQALETRWLTQAGLGIEVNTSQTWIPLSTVRLVARQTMGQHLNGFSVGLSASF